MAECQQLVQSLLGMHGSASLCRVEREKDGGYIQCISIQTLKFRLVMKSMLYVQRHLELLSGVAPSYSSKEIAQNDC